MNRGEHEALLSMEREKDMVAALEDTKVKGILFQRCSMGWTLFYGETETVESDTSLDLSWDSYGKSYPNGRQPLTTEEAYQLLQGIKIGLYYCRDLNVPKWASPVLSLEVQS